MLPDSVNSISAIILLLILANAMWPRRRKKIDTPEENSMDESLKMKIKGMSCSHCEQAVHRLLSEQDGVTNATVDLASGTASITGHAFSREKIYEEIAKLGYKASCFDDCTCC